MMLNAIITTNLRVLWLNFFSVDLWICCYQMRPPFHFINLIRNTHVTSLNQYLMSTIQTRKVKLQTETMLAYVSWNWKCKDIHVRELRLSENQKTESCRSSSESESESLTNLCCLGFQNELECRSVSFWEVRKTGVPGKKPSEQGREPITNSTHIP